MAKTQSVNTKISEVFRKFTPIATIVGFIVDVIAIISILVATDVKGNNLTIILSDIYITPIHIFGLWTIAAFTYLGFLHFYWERKMPGSNFENTFGRFLYGNLIVNFQKPILLLPALILFLLLPWILGSVIFVSLLMMGLIIIPIIFATLSVSYSDADKASKESVEKNWDRLKKRIELEISQSQWIEYSELLDIAAVLELSSKQIDFAFTKYAAENPNKAKYGIVYRAENDKRVTSEYALISAKNFDKEKYYYTG